MALKRIQDLDAAATLDGTEIIELEQSGGSVQCTAQDIANLAPGGGGGSGDVVGPASSDDAYPALFDGTTGKLLKQGSGALGTAAYTASTAYATAAQGALADSATQPGDLAAIATTGDVDDLTGFPGGESAFLRADGAFAVPAGAGDVAGPASSTDGNLVLFDGTTGKLLKDGSAPGGMAFIDDAPSDGTGYVRKDGAWAAESGGGGSEVLDVSAPSNASGTVTLDFANKSRYAGLITLGANVTTLTFSNLPGAGKFAEYELHITQDGTGSRTFAIPASHKALGGSDTAIASAANAVTVLTASTVDNGTTWRYAMQDSA